LKHGDGHVRIEVTDDAISFKHNVAAKRPRRVGSGLEAVARICADLGLSIAFDEDDRDTFLATLTVGVRYALAPAGEHKTPTQTTAQPAGASAAFSWILVDDEPVICSLFARVFAKHYAGTALHTLTRPSEVASLSAFLLDIRRASPAKPIICILDEHLVESTVDLTLAPVTGTQLRDRLFQLEPTRRLIDARDLLFVSASASEVTDQRNILILGKTGNVKSDIAHALDAAATTRSNAPPT